MGNKLNILCHTSKKTLYRNKRRLDRRQKPREDQAEVLQSKIVGFGKRCAKTCFQTHSRHKHNNLRKQTALCADKSSEAQQAERVLFGHKKKDVEKNPQRLVPHHRKHFIATEEDSTGGRIREKTKQRCCNRRLLGLGSDVRKLVFKHIRATNTIICASKQHSAQTSLPRRNKPNESYLGTKKDVEKKTQHPML